MPWLTRYSFPKSVADFIGLGTIQFDCERRWEMREGGAFGMVGSFGR